jgi:hypothetical protein
MMKLMSTTLVALFTTVVLLQTTTQASGNHPPKSGATGSTKSTPSTPTYANKPPVLNNKTVINKTVISSAKTSGSYCAPHGYCHGWYGSWCWGYCYGGCAYYPGYWSFSGCTPVFVQPVYGELPVAADNPGPPAAAEALDPSATAARNGM